MFQKNVYKFICAAAILFCQIFSAAQATQTSRSTSVDPSSTPAPLDVNDVSFLFPLQDGSGYPSINLIRDLNLDVSLFQSLLLFEQVNSTLDSIKYLDSYYLKDPAKWNVVSTRWDPCGEVISHVEQIKSNTPSDFSLIKQSPGCQPRLRIVLQPFNILGQPIPTAMHILYRLDENENLQFLADLVTLKHLAQQQLAINTTGQTLSVHPALEFEQKNQKGYAYSENLKKLIVQTIADNKKTPEIMTLAVQVQMNQWRFVGGTVQDSKWKRFVTEFSDQLVDQSDRSLVAGAEEITCNGNSICNYRPTSSLKTLSPDGFIVTDIFQNNQSSRTAQAPGNRSEEIQNKSEIIENPKRVNLFNTNCISCHVSSDTSDRTKLRLDPLWPLKTTPFVSEKYQTESLNNILNFSYWGTQPRISTRTAAESAAAANWANIKLGLSKSNETQDFLGLQKIWICLQQNENYKQCFLTKEKI